MRTSFIVVSTAVLVTVIYLYPLVLVLRGGSLAGRLLPRLWIGAFRLRRHNAVRPVREAVQVPRTPSAGYGAVP